MLTEKRDKDEYLDASRVGVGVIAERDASRKRSDGIRAEIGVTL